MGSRERARPAAGRRPPGPRGHLRKTRNNSWILAGSGAITPRFLAEGGLSQEEAVGLVVNGFVKDVLQQLPMEFAVEAQKLISISLEGSVG